MKSLDLTDPCRILPLRFLSFDPPSLYLHQVGAAEYRKLRWEGKTPLPKPILLPEGTKGTLPSREPGRDIPYRVFKPASGVSKGIHLHIHGGGWVLMSEE